MKQKTKSKTKFKQTEIGMIPEEWEVRKLEKLVIFKTGKLDSNFAELNGKYPFFTCAPEPLKINSYSFDCEAILLAGNNANGVFHINYYNGKFDAYQRTYVITTKDKSTILKYLLYQLNFRLNYLKEISQGSATKFLTIKILNNLSVPLPPLPEQRAIAKILSDLDAKIELNQQMNKTLEAIGQAIFKHWFVDFEFPNEEGKPYKSSGGEMVYNEELGKEIPKGWRVGKLGDYITQIESGSRPKGGSTDSGIPSIGAENILGLGHYDYSSTKYVPLAFYENMTQGKIKDFDVLLYKDGAQLGRTSIFGLGFPFKECCINEHVFIVRVKSPLTQIYLYFWSTLPFVKDSIINLNTNSAQPGITKEGVKGLDILVPKEEITKKFETIVKQLVIKVFKNCLESQTLSSIRDSLLPKLMSGKIRVPVEVK